MAVGVSRHRHEFVTAKALASRARIVFMVQRTIALHSFELTHVLRCRGSIGCTGVTPARVCDLRVVHKRESR